MDFKHHPDCRFGTHCYTDTWGHTEQDERCLAHNAGYQAGLAAGEAKGRTEERSDVVARLRRELNDLTLDGQTVDAIAAGHHEGDAKYFATPGASGKGEK